MIALVWNPDDDDDEFETELRFILGKDCCAEHPPMAWTLISGTHGEGLFDEVFDHLQEHPITDIEELCKYLDEVWKNQPPPSPKPGEVFGLLGTGTWRFITKEGE